MYNYVQRVFVGKASGAASNTQTAGSQLNLAAVQLGDLYLVDDNGVVLDANAAATAITTRVVRGTANGKVITSSQLRKSSHPSTKYTFQPYSAPVAQVTTYNDFGLQPNTDYKLEVVIPQDLPLVSNRQDRIEVYYTTGATISATDYTNIVTRFNKQRKGLANIIVASTTGGTTFTLSGQPVIGSAIDDYSFVRFDSAFVTLSYINPSTGLKTALTTFTAIQPSTVVPAQGGSGTPVQVRAKERISLGNFGFTDPRGVWYKGAFPYGAVDGVGYDVYNIQQLLSGEYQLQDDKKYPVSTVVAVVTGSAQKTGFGGILDAFMSGTSTTPPTGE